MTYGTGGLAVGSLRVAHWPDPREPLGWPQGDDRAFLLTTCLRRLAATTDPQAARTLEAMRPPEFLGGVHAYQFLLEVATGLHSAVPGETNVFGQFRRAWQEYRSRARHDALRLLGPLMARVIADTRAMRHDHLRGIGGASYGGLLRRLLQPRPGEPILLVGAGELARSLLPFFRAHPLGVWNRRRPGPAFAAARFFEPRDGAGAARWAEHVIITTPGDAANDERWLGWLGDGLPQSAAHLGRRRSDPLVWPATLRGYDLDDLFDLRRSQDNVRSLQLERARLACRERALALAADDAMRLATG